MNRNRKRTISSVINDKPQANRSTDRSVRKGRSRVRCYCIKCNGNFVDLRTKKQHDSGGPISVNSSFREVTTDHYLDMIQEDEIESDIAIRELYTSVSPPQFDQIQQNTQENETTDDDSCDEPELIFLPRRRVKRCINRRIPVGELSGRDSEREDVDITENEQNTDSYSSSDDDDDDDDIDDIDDIESIDDNESSEMFEDYSCPDFEPFQDPTITETTNGNGFLWILIWIMSFRMRFNLPETATESLLKFIKLLLKETRCGDFNMFPDTLYLMRKTLDIKDQFHNFAACPKCHKLYQQQEVENFRQDDVPTVMKCQHVEYPNSIKRSTRQCQVALSQKAKLLNNRISYKPVSIYPFAGIQQQLATMFRRPGFEESLRHWANRSDLNDTLADIYDGQIWKNFKETTDEDSPNFFRSELADSHLGLMLNLDWFQPYEGTNHSTGAIYAAICNLPRHERFKCENLLVLGILPSPNEVSLHKINHYLAPIIDELTSLWDGMTLNRTFECRDGKNIRAALILVSCDIPAARKICGHVSALVSCHRCEKKANYKNRQHNYAGMDNMEEWFFIRDSTQHRQNAIEW